jgi:predicted DNA-binding protein
MKTTVNFRITEEHKKQLQILADQKGVKISIIVRELITEYLEEVDALTWIKNNPNNKEIVIYYSPDTEEFKLPTHLESYNHSN